MSIDLIISETIFPFSGSGKHLPPTSSHSFELPNLKANSIMFQTEYHPKEFIWVWGRNNKKYFSLRFYKKILGARAFRKILEDKRIKSINLK